jgi:heterotetrameric sarcosine oxidase gamma subunit
VTLDSSPVFGIACDSDAGLARLVERADIGCLLVGSAVKSREVANRLYEATGIAFPLEACAVLGESGRRALWLTPRSWLIHCAIDDVKTLAFHINCAYPDKLVHATSYSDCLCWLEPCGPEALGPLYEAAFVSLEREGLVMGRAKRTVLCGLPAIILHDRADKWLFGIERSFARYFASWWAAAAARSRTISPA